jgi:hypothetical protein
MSVEHVRIFVESLRLSGYAGPVDEVRVRALGNSMTGAGSPWIMDDVTFGAHVTLADLCLVPRYSTALLPAAVRRALR